MRNEPGIVEGRRISGRIRAALAAFTVAALIFVAMHSCSGRTSAPTAVPAPPAPVERVAPPPPVRRARPEPKPEPEPEPEPPPAPPPVVAPPVVPVEKAVVHKTEVEVRVVNSAGAPVADATVCVQRRGDSKRIVVACETRTGSDGIATMSCAADIAGADVSVDQPDYPSWIECVDRFRGAAPDDWKYRVVATLEAATSIEVVIDVPRLRDVETPKFKIAAWPARAGSPTVPPSAMELPRVAGTRWADAVAGQPVRLRGLVAKQPYYVYASALGWVPVRLKSQSLPVDVIGPRILTPSDNLVHLQMAPVYLMDLTFCEEDGTPIVGSPNVEAAPHMTWSPNPDLVGWSDYKDEYVAMAFDDSNALATVTSGRLIERAVCHVDNAPARIGPMRLMVRVPGYEHVTADVYAVRATGTPDVRQYIRLRRTAVGFGAVRVRLGKPSDGAVFGGHAAGVVITTFPPAIVNLIPDDGRDSIESVNINLWNVDETVEAVGVPAGRYRAYLRCQLMDRASALRAVAISVEAGQTAELVMDVGEWSAVEVSPFITRGSDARPYSGPLVVELRHVDAEGKSTMAMWRFARAPYRVTGFCPDTYLVMCRGMTYVSKESETTAVARTLSRVDLKMGEAYWK
jgi:hypothetical protein